MTGAAPPERLDLIIDISRSGHPEARAIAEDLGVPLVGRPLPALRAWESEPSVVVDRGTDAGRAAALRSGVQRPAAVRPMTRRADSTGPVAPSR